MIKGLLLIVDMWLRAHLLIEIGKGGKILNLEIMVSKMNKYWVRHTIQRTSHYAGIDNNQSEPITKSIPY